MPAHRAPALARFPALSITLATLCALAVTACDNTPAQSDGGPGAISEGEARALDKAASILDEKRLPEGALPDVDPVGEPAGPAEGIDGDPAPKAR